MAKFGVGAAVGSLLAAFLRFGSAPPILRCEGVPEAGLSFSPWDKTWGLRWVDDWDAIATTTGEGPLAAAARSAECSVAAKGRRQLILIRHGQYKNESSHDDTIRTLTEIGKQQAQRTGVFLENVIGNRDGKTEGKELAASQLFLFCPKLRLVSSTLTRAVETAKLLASALPSDVPIAQDALLCERFPCDPQPAYRTRRAKPNDMELVERAYQKYFYRAQTDEDVTEVIVGHANVFRYFLCRALQVPPEAWLRFSLPHCSLTVINIGGNGNVSVQMVGAATHLQPDLLTKNNIP